MELNEYSWNKKVMTSDFEFSQEFLKKQEAFIREIRDVEEKMIIKVLEEYLHRPVTIEDAKKTRRIFYPGNDRCYVLAYNGEIIGTIENTYGASEDEFGNRIALSIVFIPSK